MFFPADFLHSFPYPHFKDLQSFYILEPWSIFLNHSIQHHTQYKSFNHLFLQIPVSFPLRSSLLLENASFPIAVLLLISLYELADELARYQNSLTCSILASIFL